jgi:hypothetical protein
MHTDDSGPPSASWKAQEVTVMLHINVMLSDKYQCINRIRDTGGGCPLVLCSIGHIATPRP